jgi:hypothetical protein
VTRAARDDGSAIPLILGFVLLVLLMVAGSIAAGDAFVDQQSVQSSCDGVAAAGAGALDSSAVFSGGLDGRVDLPLADVDRAIASYLSRDSSRGNLVVQAQTNSGGDAVIVRCSLRTSLAFGSFFGFGDGIEHVATATARAAVR